MKDLGIGEGRAKDSIEVRAALIVGSGLRKCFNILIQLGHGPFAPSHTGIDLSKIPTEG